MMRFESNLLLFGIILYGYKPTPPRFFDWSLSPKNPHHRARGHTSVSPKMGEPTYPRISTWLSPMELILQR